MSKQRRPVINYLINLAGMIIPLFITLISVPIYIKTIGEMRYGVLALVWSLAGFVGFLDLGLTRASENALAKARDDRDGQRAAIIMTAMVMNFALGLLGGIVLLVLSSGIFNYLINVPEAIRPEISLLLPWVAGLFPLSLAAGVIGGAFDSREKFVTANVLSVAGSSAGQIVPLLCALTLSPSLSTIVPSAVLTRAFFVFMSLIIVYYYEKPLRLRHIQISVAKMLLRYGGWVTVSSIIGPVLDTLDRFVVGSRLGLAEVTYYTVPMSLSVRIQIFAAALSRTLFPKLSRLSGAAANDLAAKTTILLAWTLATICVPSIIVARSFLTLWINSDFADLASPVAQILLVGACINGVAFIPFGLLQAQGRPELTAKIHLIEIAPYLGLLWIFVAYFGMIGAASAWTIRMAVDATLLGTVANFSFQSALRVVPPLILLIVSCVVAEVTQLNGVVAWIAGFAVFFCMASASFLFNADFRRISLQLIFIVLRIEMQFRAARGP